MNKVKLFLKLDKKGYSFCDDPLGSKQDRLEYLKEKLWKRMTAKEREEMQEALLQ